MRKVSAEGRLIILDALFASGYAAVLAGLAMTGTSGSGLPVWARGLIAAMVALPVAVRRLRPAVGFWCGLGASLLAASLDVVHEPFVAAALALYLMALTSQRWTWQSTMVLGVTSALVLAAASLVSTPDGWLFAVTPVVAGLAVLGGAWTIGSAMRERREYARRSAEQLAREAVAEERLRIARELHDIVAHSMGVIAVKAGLAGYVLHSRPAEAEEALRAIETASRGALTDLRHMLSLLRLDEEAADFRPLPGIADLPALAVRAEDAGVRADLAVSGAENLPESLGLTVYRIVQEALTNVAKHAAPTRCRVDVEVARKVVRIEIADEGSGRRQSHAPPTPGHGLIGMRERVMLCDGTFAAGPTPRGGFAVHVRLPLGPQGDNRG
ncbi:sensor histidine kinase [Amycolatopsis sp. NPDC059021]|uniref:sensor histidine kinase n=1 Tax=Amycolatopsis sp. NPDC059021 TaxID=3346704 RepID=UPI00366D3C94